MPNEWISVKDRLPDKDGRYLCYCSYGENIGVFSVIDFAKHLCYVDKYGFVGKYHSGWYAYDSEYGYYQRDSITHWMPLPEPPNGE